MKKIISVIILPALITMCFSTAFAVEKQVTIKRLYVGMGTVEARKILTQILPSNWTLSKSGETYRVLINCSQGDNDIFGNSRVTYLNAKFCPDETGFVITRDDFCEGYISTDKSGNTVTKIALSGTIIDHIYSSGKIDADAFLNQLRDQFNLPEFPWIPFGWQYISPMGYTLTVMTNKLVELKANSR